MPCYPESLQQLWSGVTQFLFPRSERAATRTIASLSSSLMIPGDRLRDREAERAKNIDTVCDQCPPRDRIL
jgi:hypothetical protein